MSDYQTARLHALLRRWRDERTLSSPRCPPGPLNSLSDVAGVLTGHCTLDQGEVQTGVTAIIPASHNLFQQPLPCGVAVLNGFAKPVGLTQLAELGQLQTPVLLSNTFAVGTLFTTLVQDAIRNNPELGRTLPTVNPLALECNDGWLNDIQKLAIHEEHVWQALNNVKVDFARGSVGAGRGMSCFGLKGGIGTASRLIPELNATLGVLVLANFGTLNALTIDGVPLGAPITHLLNETPLQQDAGSVIVIMALDAPLDARQLGRIAKRAGAGLGRLGSYWGHGSGDIAIAFSTHPHPDPPPDEDLESCLCAAADATEHAVLDALCQAETVCGFRGHTRLAFSGLLDRLASQPVG